MKILLTAFAVTIAVPAAAQTAQPAADPHAGHNMPMDHGQHGRSDHGQGGHGQASHGQSGHEGHMKCCKHADGKMADCCAKTKANGTRMDCCDKHSGKAGAADPHAGHDMSKH